MLTEKYLELKTLCKILPITEIRSIVKWCNDANINIQIIGKKRVVYRFLVEMEIDKKLIKELKIKYPTKWEELYQCYKEDDRLRYLQLLDDNYTSNTKSISTYIKPESKYAKAFADS